MNLVEYGFEITMLTGNTSGIPARITAVHKERYELVCEYGPAFGRLKTGIYYSIGEEVFPTVGDFVLINYNQSGDSQIRHQSEPGCAVRAAIDSGELSEVRWNNYQKLKKEAVYSVDKGRKVQKQQSTKKVIGGKREERYEQD